MASCPTVGTSRASVGPDEESDGDTPPGAAAAAAAAAKRARRITPPTRPRIDPPRTIFCALSPFVPRPQRRPFAGLGENRGKHRGKHMGTTHSDFLIATYTRDLRGVNLPVTTEERKIGTVLALSVAQRRERIRKASVRNETTDLAPRGSGCGAGPAARVGRVRASAARGAEVVVAAALDAARAARPACAQQRGPLEEGFSELMPMATEEGNVSPELVERVNAEVMALTGVGLDDPSQSVQGRQLRARVILLTGGLPLLHRRRSARSSRSASTRSRSSSIRRSGRCSRGG